jgi:hypothetical protein
MLLGLRTLINMLGGGAVEAWRIRCANPDSAIHCPNCRQRYSTAVTPVNAVGAATAQSVTENVGVRSRRMRHRYGGCTLLPPADFEAISHKVVKFSLCFGLLFLAIWVGLWFCLHSLTPPRTVDSAYWDESIDCVDDEPGPCEEYQARRMCQSTGYVRVPDMFMRFHNIKCRASCPCPPPPPPPKIEEQTCIGGVHHRSCRSIVENLMFACKWVCYVHIVGYLTGRFMSWLMLKVYMTLLIVFML